MTAAAAAATTSTNFTDDVDDALQVLNNGYGISLHKIIVYIAKKYGHDSKDKAFMNSVK